MISFSVHCPSRRCKRKAEEDPMKDIPKLAAQEEKMVIKLISDLHAKVKAQPAPVALTPEGEVGGEEKAVADKEEQDSEEEQETEAESIDDEAEPEEVVKVSLPPVQTPKPWTAQSFGHPHKLGGNKQHIANRQEALTRLFSKHGKPSWMSDVEKSGFVEWFPVEVSKKKDQAGYYFMHQFAQPAALCADTFFKKLRKEVQTMPKFDLIL
jgi:hypothetical protein